MENPMLSFLIPAIMSAGVYAAFPLIYAKTRKEPIEKKKYRKKCFWVNLGVHVVLFFIEAVLYGGTGTPLAMLFWTGIFRSVGQGMLEDGGKLIDPENENTDNLDLMQ